MNRAEISSAAGAVSPAANIVWFASSNLFRQVLNAGTAFLRPILLSPELFGLFSMLRLIPNYAHHIHLGARHTLRYKIPLHEAHGEDAETDRLRATVFTGTMAIAVLVSCALAAAALWIDASPEMRIGLAICAVIVLLGGVYDHFMAELKGFQLFRAVSVQNYLHAVVMLVAGAGLIWWLGFYGAILAELVVIVAMLGVLAHRRFLKVCRGFDPALFKAAVVFGAPTLLFDVSLLLMRTTDRLVIAGTLGLEQLGYYALGSIVMAYVMHVPGATREVMEAKLFQHNRTQDIEVRFDRYVLKPIRMIGFAMPVLIGPAVLMLPFVIGWALPSYAQGVPAMQVLMLGGFFLALSFPLRGMLVSSGRQIKAAGVLLASVILHVGLSYTLILAGFGIVGVAVSAGVTFLCSGAGLLLLVLRALPRRPARLGRALLLCLLPFPLMLAGLAAALQVAAATGQAPFAQLVIQLSVYGLLMGVFGLAAMRAEVIPTPRPLRKFVFGNTAPNG